uniref:CCHC-type domain-containing protein n=1 Tax=Tanacetum cinerariifolium TaxID=118510 RepID=A0A6L2KMY2_TANCI|nr:hypothetical protein [Tanacetum cinerariifolium]
MIAILEKYEHNQDFHKIVDFVEASHIRYALTVNPTVYVFHIRQFWSTARIETTDEGTKILATIDGKLRTVSESSIRINLKLNDEAGISSLPDAELFENLTLMEYNISPNQKFTFQKGQFSRQWKYLIHTIMQCLSPKSTRQYTRRARIAQSSALLPVADEPASLIGDDSEGEAYPTNSGLEADQDKANIAKTSTLPSDSTLRVTSLATDEGTQELEITNLKARVKLLEDREGGGIAQSGDDAPIKGRSLDKGEEAAERVMVPAAAEVATAIVSFPTGSGVVSTASPTIPTASPIFTTAIESTPYTRRKGKETMVESETPKKKKVQEQIDVQLARELEEEMARDAQRMNEQIARDVKIARIHVKEELQMLIDRLDRNNEVVAKYLQEYYQFATELPIERRIELISDLVKYQDHYAKILKYQTQQRKPLSRKQQKEFYMSVLKSHAGWKARHFKGMTLEEIKEKFDPVWKQFQDFIPIGSKEEAARFKRKGLRLEQESVKKLKTSKEVKETKEVPKEKVKEMMQLVPVEEVYVEALQIKHPIIDWKLWGLVKETLSIRPAISDKDMELWVKLKRLRFNSSAGEGGLTTSLQGGLAISLKGAKNHPSMLEKDMYDSWKSRMELYMMNRRHEKMILESIENGPLIWPKIEENGVTRPRKYSELSLTDTIQADCDVKEINIILQANQQPQQPEFSQLDLGLTVLEFKQSDDPIDSLNHMMSVLSAVITSCYPTTNNQLRNSTYTSGASGSNSGKQKTIICYNCKGEGHMSNQCTKPKRKRDDSWFNDKVLLVHDQANGQILHEEDLSFLVDPGIAEDVLTEDPMVLEKKVNTTPVDYVVLNQLSQDFEKRFVLQIELSTEQAFWSQNSMNSLKPSLSCTPTKVKVLKELLKAVEQHCLESKTFEVKMNQILNENERLLEQVINKDTVNIVINSSMNNASVNVHECKKSLKLERVKPSTSASGSQPSGNTKKDMIKRPPSSTQKNKVKSHPRTVKSSLKNKNCVVEPKETTNVQHSKLNANSKLICAKCNDCMFFDNHDVCVLNVINDMNAHAKSKSIKKISKRKVWKLIGNMFTKIKYTWRPTGQTFTIVGNVCPLTRITITDKVPPRKPNALETDTPILVVTLVYSRKPRKSKTNDLVSKPKIIKSISAKNKEHSKSLESTFFDVPSSSFDKCRSSKLFSGI